jgi:VWFA-related protein
MGIVTFVLAALIPQAVSPPPPEIRTLSFVALDDKGAPVDGLGPDEVAVLEDGVAREVAKVEADHRPLALALLVDSSEAIGSSYRLELVEALSHFLQKLPEQTQFSVWTTGDRPRKLVDFSDDVPAALAALKRVFPQGGNTLLDAIVEASRDLKKKEGERSAVVVVTGLGPDFSSRDQHRAVDDALGNATWFMAVEFEEGPTDFETRTRYDFTLGTLTEKTGGVYERMLSTMGAAAALEKVSSALRSSYRVRYATVGGAHPRKLEVTVARPGVRVLLGAEGKGKS